MESRIVEYLVVTWLTLKAWFIYALPTRLRLGCGSALGCTLRSLGFRRRVVRDNLKLAFADMTDAEREALERKFYHHFGNLVLELLFLMGPLKRFALNHCTFEGVEHWTKALAEARARGTGVVFLANHLGNWEVMASAGSLQIDGDVLLVTKLLKPSWLHRHIEKARLRCGVACTYEPRTMRDILKTLKRGGTVGCVIDQYMGAPTGIRVPFFGVPVGTNASIAALVKRSGAIVIPACNYRKADGSYVVSIEPAMAWLSDEDPHRELALNTAAYAAHSEKVIRARPEQWLWTHRRFKGDLGPLKDGEWTKARTRH